MTEVLKEEMNKSLKEDKEKTYNKLEEMNKSFSEIQEKVLKTDYMKMIKVLEMKINKPLKKARKQTVERNEIKCLDLKMEVEAIKKNTN